MSDYNVNMDGKVCLVTGATNGIGKAAAEAFARMGATVVLVGRSADKTIDTARQITANTNNPRVKTLLADLSVQAQVRRLADEFKANHDRLDVLFNNAGAVFNERHESADGIELTFALNHLSYFLLTNLLLKTLKASAPARIINTASEAQQSGKIDFDDLEFERRPYRAMTVYGSSKLENIMFTKHLAQQLEGTGVTVNAFHPGLVGTGFATNNGSLWKLAMTLGRPFMLAPAKGADTGIWLATAPEIAGVTGGYFEKRQPIQPKPIANDPAANARLWHISAQMTGLTVHA